MADTKPLVSVPAGTLTTDQKLDAILHALNVKGEGEYKALETKNEQLNTALKGVVAILETISNSPDVEAQTRGPLAREALALIKDATK